MAVNQILWRNLPLCLVLPNAEPIEKHQELFKSAIAKLNTIDPIAIQEGTWEEDLKSFIE